MLCESPNVCVCELSIGLESNEKIERRKPQEKERNHSLLPKGPPLIDERRCIGCNLRLMSRRMEVLGDHSLNASRSCANSLAKK